VEAENNMKRIFVPTESGSDWQRFLAKPTLHWKPGRSAMTLAAAWEATPDRFPPEVASTLDASGDERLSGLRLLAAVPEYQVDLPGGDTASQPEEKRGQPLKKDIICSRVVLFVFVLVEKDIYG
jgi:hypothetical protein